MRKALQHTDGEVFVVDNNSVDGSVQMVREKFPEVHLIANTLNTGFSKANNQAIRIAKGEYILLLNPDTIVEETTFDKVIAFMDRHPEAGGLGVQMLDGKGRFLPESKRGLPTPAVAFYKIFGLSALFPRSKRFGRYHLGYLDQQATNEIDILSGAFMLMRKKALDKVGLLDEEFFMYGEDIDLSYRIQKGGWKNFYYHDTRIIHYKGESTKKSSVNYVFVFYRAMIIFAQKHFSQQHARLFSFLINLAVYLRAGTALIVRLLKTLAVPLWDAGVLLIGLYFIKNYYESEVKLSGGGNYYSSTLVNLLFPIYTVLWLLAVYFSGGYDRPIRLQKIVRGVFAGTAIILIGYALLPESWRFSRALILFGAAWALASLLLSRLLFHTLRIRNLRIDSGSPQRIAIVGSPDECKRVQSLLNQTGITSSFIGFVSHTDVEPGDTSFIGRFGQLSDIITIYGIDEVIFCARDLPSQLIIDCMAQLHATRPVDYKIAPPESLSIIGSNSIDTAGDLYVIDINSVNKPVNRRNKRVFDLGIAFVLLMISPLIMWIMYNPIGFLRNLFRVCIGTHTWVGYAKTIDENMHLPKLRKAILCVDDLLPATQRSSTITARLNMLYAKDYKIKNDLTIIIRAIRNLGR